jgi:hypothetical protein
MPRQDAHGRWYSDDGGFYWDGVTWRAVAAQVPATRKPSVLTPILIGGGFTVVVVLVLGIALLVLMFNNTYVQRSFCNGWYNGQNSTENLACPFHPPSP